MKISKALKLKNKLVAEYADTLNRMASSNSYLAESKKNYNAKELYEKALKYKDDIIRLKTAIHEASAPIRSKIFEMSELKTFLMRYNNLDTREGLVRNHSMSGAVDNVYVVDITEAEKQSVIDGIKGRIELLQDELDTFNAITDVAF